MQEEKNEAFRLSSQQKHLWLLQQADSSFSFRTQSAIMIEGLIDLEALKSSVDSVINRQEILRTTFHCAPGEIIPLQVITNGNPPPIVRHDLSALTTSEQTIEIEAIFQKTSQLHFDFEKVPILHLSLIILSQNKYILLLSLSSLYADSVTLKNLVHEISCDYAGLSEQLYKEPIQYVDYAEWQHELLTAEDTIKGRDYWGKQDISNISNFKIPGENQSSLSKDFQPKSITITISSHIVEELKLVADEYNTSISVFLQTIWHILLWRLTGQTNLIIGVSYDGRPYEELHKSFGLFAKYLPIHSNLTEQIQFSEVLKQVDETTNTQYKWQNYFSWDVIGGFNSNDKNIPWFPVSYNFAESADKCIAKNLTFYVYKQFICIDKFKLNLSCLLKKDNEIIADFYYDSNLFLGENVKDWAEQFQTLLENAIENPLRAISQLEILREPERQKLLFWCKNTETNTNYGKIECLHQLFEKQADITPDNIAVVFDNQQLTYAQLNQSANQLAYYLQSLGVESEVLVGICMERSLEAIIALLAVLKAGGAYVPLEPRLNKERLDFIVKDTQIKLILAKQSSALNLPEHKASVVFLDTDWDVIAQQSSENLVSAVTPANLVYVLYTSGSTGKPKGVAVEHRQLFNYLYGILDQLNLPNGASFALVSTFAADLGNTAIFPALCTGGCLHVISDQRASNADELAAYCQNHGGIDCLKIVPSHLNALLNSCQNPAQILPRHRLILGGEALSWDKVEKLERLAPDCTIINHYGPTEATVGVVTYQVENLRRDISSTVPLGRPLGNSQILILNEHLQPVPIGIPGELYIGGANLARGYFNRPDLTGEKFIPNPFENKKTQSRLYKTGDLARFLNNGNIEFLGRIDHQVKIRGFRVELGEIETVLQQHPTVRETVAIALDDERGEKRLVAYIVPHPGQGLPDGLRSFLQKKLPDYMVPSAFVMLDALPLMVNGKLDRHALPAPDWANPELKVSFIAPSTPEELLLANIWAEVLGVESVGIEDNFFELGGDSILCIQIVARAKEKGLCLNPMQLFHHQTIAELIAAATKTPQLQIEQGLVTGEVPLTPIQHWFFEQNLPEPHHWNMSILLETPPNVNIKWLQQVLEELNQHHDTLRLRFERVGDSWQQIYTSDKIAPLSQIDLSHLPESEQATAIETEVAKAHTNLDLSTTLMQVALFNLGDNQPGRLVIIIHHLVVDGISWRIWLEDFHKAYQQLSLGKAIELGAKTTSFKHWAECLSIYARSNTLQEELDYWLQSSFRKSRLPRDNFDQPNTVANLRTVSVSVSVEETQALLQKVPAVYKTQINDLLLTALGLAFKQWTGENTLLVDLEGHGREPLIENVDVSRTIGWFTTHFPVVLDLSGESESSVENGKIPHGIGLAVKSVKEQLRRIPNRGIGYGVLRYLSENPEITKQLKGFPQAEVSFNYLGQLDRVLTESTPFRLVKEFTSSERSPQGKRTHLIAIDAIVLDGKLQLNWTYNENIYRYSTIKNLAENFVSILQQIICHCLTGAKDLSPDDFELAELDRKQLDRLSSKFGIENIEDIYSLSPLQQGLLFHSLYDQKSRMYFQQKIFTLQGKLNIPTFVRSWEQVVNRYPSLRTIFIWEELAQPLQVVLKGVEISWDMQNWSGISSTEQEQQLQAYLQADLQQGFSLSDRPTMRLALIQTATDIYQLIWSHHHLILDGWCNSIILKEVFSFYEALSNNEDLYLESSPPYKNYIAWLQQQDWRKAETFWTQTLSGLHRPTLLDVESVSNLSNRVRGYAQEEIYLGADATSVLKSFARQHHLTLNTLIQGAWALLLSRYSGEEDVIFGITVSGRPTELPGVEAMVGLLINTLPMRVQVSPDLNLISWLQKLQYRQTEMLEYQHSSLVQIQEWSEIPQGTPLFHSFVTFENYPVDVCLREQSGSLKILNVRFFFETNYPLSVTVEPGSELLIRIDYFPNKFDADTISRILKQLQSVLENIPVNAGYPLSHISLTTETTAVESQLLVNSFNVDLE